MASRTRRPNLREMTKSSRQAWQREERREEKRLAKIDTKASAAEIRRWISSQSIEKKMWAASIIGSRRQKRWLTYVRQLSKDKSPFVRSRAVWAAGAIGGPIGFAIAVRALKDPNESVKRTAKSVISRYTERRAAKK